MLNPIKTALKVSAGLFIVGAATGVGVGYLITKGASQRYKRTAVDDENDIDFNSNADSDSEISAATEDIRAARKKAMKDIVRAGRDIKGAWDRIQHDVKVITKKSVDKLTNDEAEEDDD